MRPHVEARPRHSRTAAIEVTLTLTDDCNLRCAYCYQKTFTHAAMPVATAIEALRSAIGHGADSLAVTFFGGEPLLQADAMFEILGEAGALEAVAGVPVTAKVSTNGVLLDEAIVDEAGRAGLFISLSIDGGREAQDAGRRTADGESCFDQVDRALRLLAASERPFAVYSVITPDNVAFFAESLEYLWDAGARIIINTMDYTAAWNEGSLLALRRQYKLAGKFYRRLLQRREFFHLEPFDSRISQRTRAGEYSVCSPGLSQVLVAPDGALYGCVEYYLRRLMPLGTASGWLDPAAVKALTKDRIGRPQGCRECAIRARCNNSCSCVNLRGTGRASQPPLSLCLCEQETVRQVDAVAAGVFKRKVPEFLMRHYSCSYHMLSGIEKLLETMEVGNERT